MQQLPPLGFFFLLLFTFFFNSVRIAILIQENNQSGNEKAILYKQKKE